MAYTVNGTTVIDNSRNLSSIESATLKKVVETAVALGNSGTSKTIDLANGTVYTSTLTGNCTFTVSNPGGVSSFSLLLTNDGTAGRTVAWAGGSFRFPGGASSLTRTTAANGIDLWVFFTPDSGTTYYGNIAFKNLAA